MGTRPRFQLEPVDWSLRPFPLLCCSPLPQTETSHTIRQLDHVAIHVADVPRSIAFYQDVMGLVPMPRPDFDFPGAWFHLGSSQHLHLIGNRDQTVHSHHRGTHFALQVDDLDVWEKRIDKQGAERLARKIRPDGALQTFVKDPDGHWIELCKLPIDPV